MKATTIIFLVFFAELGLQNDALCSAPASRPNMTKYCWITHKNENCLKDSKSELYTGGDAFSEAQRKNSYTNDLDGNISTAAKIPAPYNQTSAPNSDLHNVSAENAQATELGQAHNQDQVIGATKDGKIKTANEWEKLSGENRFLSDDMNRTAKVAAEKAQEIARLESGKRAAAPATSDSQARARALGAINDVELTQEIKRKVYEGEKVSEEEASKAYDPAIRKSLLTIPLGYEAKEEIKQEETKLSTTLAQLTQMASLAAARSKGMGTQEGAGQKSTEDKATAQSIAAAKAAQQDAARDPEALADLAIDKLLDEKLAAALAKAEAANKASGKSPLTPEEKISLRNKLRAGLQKQLIAQAKAAAEAKSGALDSFTGGLNREQVASSQSSEEEAAHGLGDVIGSTFSAVKEAGFSMAHSDTEAAVNGFISESSRDLASASAEFLGPDSPSLFLRATNAHRRCQARKCIEN